MKALPAPTTAKAYNIYINNKEDQWAEASNGELATTYFVKAKAPSETHLAHTYNSIGWYHNQVNEVKKLNRPCNTYQAHWELIGKVSDSEN